MFRVSHQTPYCNVHKSVENHPEGIGTRDERGELCACLPQGFRSYNTSLAVTRGLRRQRTTERDPVTITLVQRSVSVPPGAKK